MRKLTAVILILLSLTGWGQTLIVVGSIASSQYICTSCLPDQLTSTPPNGTAPTYQWQSSLNNSTFSNIAGATMTTYQPDYLPATNYYRQMQNATGVFGGPVATNKVTLTVTNTQLLRILQNDTITGIACYNAIDTLTIAEDDSHAWRAQSGSYVTMFVGQVIQFLPGAHIDSGSYLYAYTRSSIKAINQIVRLARKKVNGVEMNKILKVNGIKNY